jgi:hypothetical protein
MDRTRPPAVGCPWESPSQRMRTCSRACGPQAVERGAGKISPWRFRGGRPEFSRRRRSRPVACGRTRRCRPRRRGAPRVVPASTGRATRRRSPRLIQPLLARRAAPLAKSAAMTDRCHAAREPPERAWPASRGVAERHARLVARIHRIGLVGRSVRRPSLSGSSPPASRAASEIIAGRLTSALRGRRRSSPRTK